MITSLFMRNEEYRVLSPSIGTKAVRTWVEIPEGERVSDSERRKLREDEGLRGIK